MRRGRRYSVACLSGAGIGPELMGEASRALAEASRLHGFRLDEVHVPFGGEAIARHAHPLPAVTRAACRGADAVLVALSREPALVGVEAELDLSWQVQRVRLSDADLAIVSALDDEAERFAVGRAFELARVRRGRLAAVGEGAVWRAVVAREAEAHPGVQVERSTPSDALPLLMGAPERFCVVLAQQAHAQLLADLAGTSRDEPRIVAAGRLSRNGPGTFGPTHGPATEIAGQGVANPSGMLLAAALMLSEGLGERAAARTLERAVSRALADGWRTPDVEGRGVPATTRAFTSAVLERMPSSRTDLEFALEPA